MKQEDTQIQQKIHLIGLSAFTEYEAEMSEVTSMIRPTIQRYWQEKIGEQIPHRKNPGVTFSVYSEYQTDEYGAYRYFYGEEVTSFDTIPEDLHTLTIPVGRYKKFITNPGIMPGVVIQAWQHIWQLNDNELGGKRNYIADFEIYDQRAQDPNNTIVDVYVGVNGVQ